MEQTSKQQEYENFCCNITWLRKSHNLSKKEMAKRLGIGVESLNKLESGTIPPNMTVEVLNNLCKHFHINLSDQFSLRLEEKSDDL